jgi:tetratricopeptide (TPR) repeat protein
MEKINFPSQEIINPRGLMRKNYEHIILWMLFNNDGCEWGDFSKEPISIPEATLSRYLGSLHKKGFITKVSRGHYKITSDGKKRYHELSKYKRKRHKLNYPPEIILKSGRNYEHWIIWMLYNNEYCRRSDFSKEPLNINQNALSKNLKYLIERDFVQKTDHLYKITQSGKLEYSKMLGNYDLDRQTILEEESKRIDEITLKTTRFFDEYNITDEEVKFRYLNKVLKLDYSKVSMILTDEEDFHKILLFISVNHPNYYPNYISLEKFSNLYQIKKKVLDFWIDEIVSGNIYDIKIHQLEVSPDRFYFFESNEKLEKMLRAITEDYITKNKYLQKFGSSEGFELLINNILNEICVVLFNKDLMESLREFLPGYIKHLAYKIETKKRLTDAYDKLEGIIWHNMANLFHSQASETLEEQYQEDLKEIERLIALDPVDYDSYNEKIRILIYYNQYAEVLAFLDEMLGKFPEKEIELLMKKASILKMRKEVEAGLVIVEDLLEKYPKNTDLQNYRAYWLRYLGKKEEAIEILQQLIKNYPENATYHDTLGEILLYFEEFDEAAKKFLKAIVLNNDSWFIYQTYIKLGSCYLALEKYDLAVKNLTKGKELIHKNVNDLETKKNWLTIADLFLAEIMELENKI